MLRDDTHAARMELAQDKEFQANKKRAKLYRLGESTTEYEGPEDGPLSPKFRGKNND